MITTMTIIVLLLSQLQHGLTAQGSIMTMHFIMQTNKIKKRRRLRMAEDNTRRWTQWARILVEPVNILRRTSRWKIYAKMIKFQSLRNLRRVSLMNKTPIKNKNMFKNQIKVLVAKVIILESHKFNAHSCGKLEICKLG